MKGFSLIELLISLTIFSFALLGLAKLSIKTMLSNHSAYLYCLADQQVFSAAELIYSQSSIQPMQTIIAKLLPEARIQQVKQGQLRLITVNWYDKYHEQNKKLALNSVVLALYDSY